MRASYDAWCLVRLLDLIRVCLLSAFSEIGEGEGHGFNLNVPLPMGTGDAGDSHLAIAAMLENRCAGGKAGVRWQCYVMWHVTRMGVTMPDRSVVSNME